MAFMAERGFVCPLCGKEFSRVTGDLILPEIEVCDECLAGLTHLQGPALWAYIEEHRIIPKKSRAGDEPA